MPRHLKPPRLVAATALLLLGASVVASSGALAQSSTTRRHVAPPQSATTVPPVDYRGLTITRPPDAAPDQYGQDDIYADGPIRYNDIRDFSPFPYADSGRQFPYGFDGIGGYGSDVGYNEGQDAALYDRGAFNREAR